MDAGASLTGTHPAGALPPAALAGSSSRGDGGRGGQQGEASEKLDAVAALLAAVGSYVGVKHLFDEGRLLGCGTPVRSLFASLEVLGAALVVDSRFVLRPAPWNPNFRVVELAHKLPASNRVHGQPADPVLEKLYERHLTAYLRRFRSATVGSLGLAHPPPTGLHTTCADFVQARVDSGVFRSDLFTVSRRGATQQVVISLSHAAPHKAAQPTAAKHDDAGAPGSASPGFAAMRLAEADEAQPLTPVGSGMRRQRSDLDRLPITLDDDDDGFGDALIVVGDFRGTPAALKAAQQQQRAGAGSGGGAAAGEQSAPAGGERRSSSKPVCRYGLHCRNFPACAFEHPAGMVAVTQDTARAGRHPAAAPRGQSGRTPHRGRTPRGAPPLLVVYNSSSPYRTPEKKKGGEAPRRESPGVGRSPQGGTAGSAPAAEQQAGAVAPRSPWRPARRKYAPPLHQAPGSLPMPVPLPSPNK